VVKKKKSNPKTQLTFVDKNGIIECKHRELVSRKERIELKLIGLSFQSIHFARSLVFPPEKIEFRRVYGFYEIRTYPFLKANPDPFHISI